MITLLILYIFTLLFSLRFERRDNLSYFPKELTTFLKGLLPVFILIHHSKCFQDFTLVGEYVVGLFFFISGFGLESCRKGTKNNFMALFHRLNKLFLPLVVPCVIYITLLLCLGRFSLNDLIGYKVILPYTWFIVSLVIMYILYYSVTTACKEPMMVCIMMTIVIVAMIGILTLLKVSSTYRVSSLAFLVGIYAFNTKSILMRCINGKNFRYICLFTLAFITLFAILDKGCSAYILIPLWCLCVVSGLCSSGFKFSIKPLGKFLSKISYEFYIVQGITVLLVNNILNISNIVYRGGVFAGTIII